MSNSPSSLPQQSIRAAIYARYSSDMQRPTSIEDQNRNCIKFAEASGFAVLNDYMKSDSAQSGAALALRPGLNCLIPEAKKTPRPFDVVLIDDTSRLGRCLSDVLRVSDILKHHGVFLYFVSQKLDSRDPNFRQLLIMHGMMDEQYLVGLADKVHRGQEGRVLNGFLPGGKCYGYRNVPIEDPSRKGRYGRPAVTGVQQEIIDEERIILIRIFQSYANGYSLSRIAKMLNAEGVPSPQRPKRRTPRSWCPSGIRDILRNERYRGVIVWNRTHKVRNPETGRKETRRRLESEWVRAERPELRIISEELWMRVQHQIKLVSEKWGPKRIGGFYRTKKSSTYLFSGLLVCGVCGGGMTVTGSDNGGTRTIYGCFAHRFRGVCPNDLNIRREVLEQQLIDGLTSRLRRPDILEHAITSFYEKLRQRPKESQKAAREAASQSGELRERLGVLTKQAENICDAIAANGHRNSPSLLSRLSTIEAEIGSINTRLAQAETVSEIPISHQQLRDFVVKRVGDFESILLGDPILAKDALRKHVGQLVLSPRQTPSGPVFEVSGDVNLFAGDSHVMLMVARGGIEPPYKGFADLSNWVGETCISW